MFLARCEAIAKWYTSDWSDIAEAVNHLDQSSGHRPEAAREAKGHRFFILALPAQSWPCT
jgi:hypothetical protein